jgi:hypothetical protein
MRKVKTYKLDDNIDQNFQEICKLQTEQGKGRITPAYLVEQYVIDYVEKNKKLLEGRK